PSGGEMVTTFGSLLATVSTYVRGAPSAVPVLALATAASILSSYSTPGSQYVSGSTRTTLSSNPERDPPAAVAPKSLPSDLRTMVIPGTRPSSSVATESENTTSR